MSERFQQAAAYAAKGWRVLRVYGLGDDGKTCLCKLGAGCPTPGKHPMDWAWQRSATTDEDVIGLWYDGEAPEPNVGVALGAQSGIIDVEWDGEEGKATAVRHGLVGCQTPTYVSSRSEHRIFRYDSILPQQGVYKIGGLEVRIGGGDRGSQSVFPPSLHASGVQYRWKEGYSPDDVEVANLPDSFMNAILNATGGGSGATMKEPARALLHKKATPGDRHHMLVRMAASMCVKMTDCHDPVEQQEVLLMLRAVNTTQCVPPKTPEEVETIWRSELRWAIKIRSTDCDRKKALEAHSAGEEEEEAVAAEAVADSPFSLTGLEYRDNEWWPGRWKLAVVRGDPVAYVLTIPTFGDGDEKTVDVTVNADIYRSASKIAHAVLEATHTVILDEVPEDWYGIWNGRGRKREQPAVRGLKAKLMDVAVQREATAEHMRYAQVAEWFLAAIMTTPSPAEEEDHAGEPDCHGAPAWVRGRDGVWELWFSWSRVWESVDRGRRKIEEGDQLGLKKRIMALTGESKLLSGRHTSEGGVNRRYIRFVDKHIRALERLASGEISLSMTRQTENDVLKVRGKVESWTEGSEALGT